MLCFQSEIYSATAVDILSSAKNQPLRVLGVLPLPGRSHFVMTGKLMRELAQRGHQVDVISVFPPKQPIQNYHHIDITPAGLDTSVSNVTYDDIKLFAGLSMSYFVNIAGIRSCEMISHSNMQEVLKSKKGAYDVIVVEVINFLLEI